MDVSKYKRGNWLKASDTRTGEIIEFLDGGIEVDGFGGKPAIEFLVKLSDGSEIKMTPNKMSISALADAWEDESSKWIGKQAIIEVKTEIIQGEDKEFIVLTPNEDVEPAGVNIKDEDIPVIDPDESEKANSEAQVASDDENKGK